LVWRHAKFAQSLGTNHVTAPCGTHDALEAVTLSRLLDQFHQTGLLEFPHVIADLLAGGPGAAQSPPPNRLPPDVRESASALERKESLPSPRFELTKAGAAIGFLILPKKQLY
jgi:hypothetical protein